MRKRGYSKEWRPEHAAAYGILNRRVFLEGALVAAVVVTQAFLKFPSVARAEPVTFLFNVQIDQRCSVDPCDSFSAGRHRTEEA